MKRTSQIRGTSRTEQVLSITFVLCAVVAAFLVMHKKELMNGEIDQVISTYISEFGSDDETTDTE